VLVLVHKVVLVLVLSLLFVLLDHMHVIILIGQTNPLESVPVSCYTVFSLITEGEYHE
jgi:hypothetical protein